MDLNTYANTGGPNYGKTITMECIPYVSEMSSEDKTLFEECLENHINYTDSEQHDYPLSEREKERAMVTFVVLTAFTGGLYFLAQASIRGIREIIKKITLLNDSSPKVIETANKMPTFNPKRQSVKAKVIDDNYSDRLAEQLTKEMNELKDSPLKFIELGGFHAYNLGFIRNIPQDYEANAVIKYDSEKEQFFLEKPKQNPRIIKGASVKLNDTKLTSQGSIVYFKKGINVISFNDKDIFQITLK